MIPQLIWIALALVNLILIGYKHGKEKTGKHNAYVDLITMFLSIWLLFAGGFFEPLFR
jgi:hypothetical protein